MLYIVSCGRMTAKDKLGRVQKGEVKAYFTILFYHFTE
jgi:hypothetical protein